MRYGRQRAEVEVEELVERAGVDDLPAVGPSADRDAHLGDLEDVAGVHVEEDGDEIVLEHVLEERGVALGGHPLMGGLREVPVVVADEDRHAPGDRGVDLVGRLPPLLHRVVQEDVLIDVVGDLDELGVVLLAKLHDRDLLVLAEGVHELPIEALALLVPEGEPEGAVVEGHRHERAVNVGENLVLVVGPLGEAREELVHAVVHGVIDVRAVLVDEDARVVEEVVGVAGDVVAALEDADLEPAGLGEAARAGRPGVARADDDRVKAVGVEAGGKALLDAHGNPLCARRGTRRVRPFVRLILSPRTYNGA